MSDDPDWLRGARELQAIAQSGLTFTQDVYDRERYERIRELAATMFAGHVDMPADRIADLFAHETGYATPKVDVRAAIFDAEGRILMVRESADNDRWTLPGGWADVNATPAENAVREVFEESGYEVQLTKLAAVLDRSRQGHPSGVFSCYKMFFIGRMSGGAPTGGIETSEVGWFAEAEVPGDLSLARVLPGQVARMFDHFRSPLLPTEHD